MIHGVTEATQDRIDAFVADIEAIPATLERLADAASVAQVHEGLTAALAGRPLPRNVLMTGLGSSRYAALQAEAAFGVAGFAAAVAPASADQPGGIARGAGDVLTIAISSSGRTTEVVDAATRARQLGPVLAITRDADSALGRAAGGVIPLPVQPEASGIAITSFVATIGVLLGLAAEIGPAARPDFASACTAARAVLSSRSSWLPAALDEVRGEEEVAVVAPWSLRGVAEQAALLFREGPRRTAAAFETAEWLHVGVYTALPGSAIGMFEGSAADDEVARTVSDRGGRVIRLPTGAPGSTPADLPDDSPGDVRALSAIIAPGLLAAAWWRAISPRLSDRGT